MTGPDALLRAAAEIPSRAGAPALVGLGVDMADLPPFRRHLNDRAFLGLVFTPAERDYCLSRPDPVPHLAARFAAKEAAVKALHAIAPLAIPQVEVVRDGATGAPSLRLVSRRGEALPDVGPIRLLVSLSHGTDCAIAVVAALRTEGF